MRKFPQRNRHSCEIGKKKDSRAHWKFQVGIYVCVVSHSSKVIEHICVLHVALNVAAESDEWCAKTLCKCLYEHICYAACVRVCMCAHVSKTYKPIARGICTYGKSYVFVRMHQRWLITEQLADGMTHSFTTSFSHTVNQLFAKQSCCQALENATLAL